MISAIVILIVLGLFGLSVLIGGVLNVSQHQWERRHPRVLTAIASISYPNLDQQFGRSERSEISPAVFIEPQDLMDEPQCAWCMKEKAIAMQPHETHGICQRHKEMMLEEAKRFSKSVHV
jgi:hypothetical protein